jgi:hypothetical protein
MKSRSIAAMTIFSARMKKTLDHHHIFTPFWFAALMQEYLP